MADTTVERRAFADAMAVLAAIAVAIGALMWITSSRDQAMVFHGVLLLAGADRRGWRHRAVVAGRRRAWRPIPDRIPGWADQGRDDRGRHLGHRGLRGRRRAGMAAGVPGAQFRSAVDQLRAPQAAAYVGGDLRIRRQCADRHVVLRRAAHMPRPPRRPLVAVVRGVGLPAVHRDRRHRLSARRHAGQGVRRAGMVCGPAADRHMGHLPARLPRHAGAAQGAAHLRRQLVLSRVHRHRGDAAPRQQRDGSGFARPVPRATSCSPVCRMR